MPLNWKHRQARAARLADTHPVAAELLSVYREVLTKQEAVAEVATRSAWTLDAPTGVDRKQSRAFARFVRDVSRVVTPVLTVVGERLCAGEPSSESVLDAFLRRESLQEAADGLRCEPLALEFFPRAFVQPVAEVVVARATGATGESAGDGSFSADQIARHCPACGRPPQVSVLRDDAEVRGQRWLVCSLCESEWVYPRSTCPQCGEVDAKKLGHHVSDSWPHLRVEECETCRTYHKALDLRIDGAALPMVDDVASVELDLWATERGLEKLQVHLLGL